MGEQASGHAPVPAQSGPHLVEEEPGGGEAGEGEEAQDGGVQRGVRLDDVEHCALVHVLKDGANLWEGVG